MFLLKNGLTIFVLLGSIALGAQSFKGLSIESGFQYGRILKHSPKLTFDIHENSVGGRLNFKFKTYGKKAWHQLQGYPEFGLAFTYYRLGHSDSLGHAFGFHPHISVPVFNKNRWSIQFHIGTGIAYLTQTYNPINNANHNAIGSKVNALFGLEWTLYYQLRKKWMLGLGINFTHYSNGAGAQPNFGLNIPSLALMSKYTPNPIQEENFQRHDITKVVTRKWGFGLFYGLAFREATTHGGPKYAIHTGSMALLYALNRINRLALGIDYEFSFSAYRFGKHVEEFNSEKEARWRSSRVMIYAANEFIFGQWSIVVQAGAYTSSQFYLTTFPIYTKLGLRYYIPIYKRSKVHVGFYLKAHMAIAEYIGFGLGYSFGKP